MIEEITFLNSSWIWQICLGAVFLWIVCIWKEWDQFRTFRFWIRIGVAFLGIVALVLIALKPALPISTKKTKGVVLTTGYKKKQLDSLKKVHKKLKVVSYAANQPMLKNIHTLDTVFVLGEGVAPFDFWQLEGCKINYLKGNFPSGVIRFVYDQQNTVGERLSFSGLYNGPKKGNQLILEGPGGNSLDSIVLTADKKQSFQLSTTLKATGNYVFSLIEKETDGTIATREPIPVTVEERIGLRILIVNNFPTFETKYLKNYLSEMGHQVLVKSKITKGKYKFEYFNMDRIAMGTFSIKNLASFDLVILDAVSLQNLAKNSRMALENSVREKGLGVFIQPDANFFSSRQSISTFNFISEKDTEITLNSVSKVKISKYPFLFKKQFGLGSIHTNPKGNIVSAYTRLGKGKVGTTLLENTYEILLSGKAKQYQQLWSNIIEDIAKKETAILDWDVYKTVGYIHQPYTFQLRTDISEPKVVVDKGYHIAMRREIDISNSWYGTTYPETQNMLKNSNYFDHQDVTKNKTAQLSPLKPINPIGVFVFFLICMGYLWVVPKIQME